MTYLRTLQGVGGETIQFADVDGDGRDELIECGGKVAATGQFGNGCAMRSLGMDHIRAIDQLNIPQLIRGPRQAFTSDYDENGFHEVGMLGTEENDLYLYFFESPAVSDTFLRIKLDSLAPARNGHQISLDLTLQRDVNGDGYRELFIRVSVGFSIYPRRCYRLDVKNRELLRGPVGSTGFYVVGDQSNHPEYLTGSTTSAGNRKDGVDLPYPDLYDYAFALDAELQLLFEPVICADYPGKCRQVNFRRLPFYNV
ncbi:MAG: hypothetical protein U5L96_09910 [Owenweeksia sp.]|nr:hypothetical protein [Owenweeksia sp.]